MRRTVVVASFFSQRRRMGTSGEDKAHPSQEWLMGVACLSPVILQEPGTSTLTYIGCLKIGEMNLS